jgi:hypothetical protein
VFITVGGYELMDDDLVSLYAYTDDELFKILDALLTLENARTKA